MLVFASSGRLLRQLDVADSSPLLLGLAFHRVTGALLVVDFGGKAVRQVDPVTGASSVFAVIPADAAAGPNALAFDRAGNVYLSDSFQGAIWRAGPQDGRPTAWVRDALLTIAGVPPLAPTGSRSTGPRRRVIANTGNDTVVRIPVASAPRGAGGVRPQHQWRRTA